MSDAEGPSIDALLADSDWVRALARSLVGRSRADDVVQDAWLSALEHGPRSASRVRGWFGTVLRNSVRRMHRSDARRAAREADAARREEASSTLDVVVRFSTQQAVAAAVLELPTMYRDAILLRFYEDLSLQAIAAREGLSLAGAHKRVTHGLELLRRSLEVRLGTRERHWTLALAPLAGLPRGSRAALAPAKVGAALALALLVFTVLRVELFPARARDLALERRDVELGPATRETAGLQSGEGAASLGSARLAASLAVNEPCGAPSGAPGAVRVQVVFAGDDAEPVVVRLRPAAGFLPAGGARAALCAPRGCATFEELAPGSWLAESDRGGSCAVLVEPNAELEVELALPAGPSLAGLVVDAEGHSVPGAEVWLSPESAASATPLTPFVDDVVAIHTDERGRFRIGSIGAARTIGAHAAGHAPCADVALDPWTDPLAELRLVLPGPGAVVSGVVLAAGEEPLAGASVYVDAAGDGSHELRTQADARGRFRFDSVAPGARRYVARAPGHAPLRERVIVEAGEERALVLTLSRGFTVEGRVTDERGQALAGVSVFAARRPWSALPDERHGVTAESDAGGRYRLAGIAPRAAWLVAQVDGGGRIERLVEGEEGALVRVDLCLAPPVRFAGRIVDEHGDGVAGCALSVVAPDEWPPRRVLVDDLGRFALALDDELVHELWIEERGVALARRIDVYPQAGEARIALADSERPTAGLAGVLVDGRGHPVDARGLHLRLGGGPGGARDVATRDEGGGRFRAEALLPGVFEVELLRPGRSPQPLGAVTLTAFETVELGRVAAEPRDGDRP